RHRHPADRPAPEFDKGTLARTLIGLYGQVTRLPDRRKAYGSSPLVKFLHSQRCHPQQACGHRRMQVSGPRRRSWIFVREPVSDYTLWEHWAEPVNIAIGSVAPGTDKTAVPGSDQPARLYGARPGGCS